MENVRYSRRLSDVMQSVALVMIHLLERGRQDSLTSAVPTLNCRRKGRSLFKKEREREE